MRLPMWHSGKESSCQCRGCRFDPGSGRSPGEGNGYLLQYSSLENFYGQRSLVGYSPWGCKELEITEGACTHTNTHTHTHTHASCLYILEINPLSIVSLANIFSHSEDCVLVLLMISFAVLKFLIRCSYLSLFSFSLF